MSVICRRLAPGEEGEYRRVHLESLLTFPDNFGTRHEDQRLVERLPFEDFISSASEDNFVFGAFVDGELLAIAGFRREGRPKTRHRGEIVQMFVSLAAQGRGIGEMLLRSVIEAAFDLPDMESIELSAVAENDAARRLYERVGFTTYGIRRRHFKLGDRYWDQRFMELHYGDYRPGFLTGER
jgi:RimJ/RimL family protein N-acetyltransferase